MVGVHGYGGWEAEKSHDKLPGTWRTLGKSVMLLSPHLKASEPGKPMKQFSVQTQRSEDQDSWYSSRVWRLKNLECWCPRQEKLKKTKKANHLSSAFLFNLGSQLDGTNPCWMRAHLSYWVHWFKCHSLLGSLYRQHPEIMLNHLFRHPLTHSTWHLN